MNDFMIEDRIPYPLEKEQELYRAIGRGDRDYANELLNKLLEYILFFAMDDEEIHFRVSELIVVMIRAAAAGGMEINYALQLTRRCLEELQYLKKFEEITQWLGDNLRNIVDQVFSMAEAGHSDIMLKVIGYMKRNYSRKLTLEEAAGFAGYTPTYFSRIFREDTGMSFSDFLSGIRVEKGKSLLINTKLTVAEAAALLGFSDQSHFGRTFKKITGVTPDQYRKNAFRNGVQKLSNT